MVIKRNEIKVLRALCRDARRTLEDIGNETGLTGPGVGKIIDRLEKGGIVESYIAVPALDKIGFKVVSVLLFRWDHSKSDTTDLDRYLKEEKGIIFASPIEGGGYTHMLVSAHPDFEHMTTFVEEFRRRWDRYLRDDCLLLMSPSRPARRLNFEVF